MGFVKSNGCLTICVYDCLCVGGVGVGLACIYLSKDITTDAQCLKLVITANFMVIIQINGTVISH